MLKNGSINETYKPLQNSIYHQYMAWWLEIFPRQQIHIVDGDKLIENPYKEVVKVEKFLRLRHKITKGKFLFDNKKGFYCLKPKRSDNGCLGDSKGNTPPPIRPEVLQKLKAYFKPLNIKFFDQINRNFTW